MRYKLFPSFYDLKRVKYINSQIKKHLLRRRDSPAGHATKTSTVKHVDFGNIRGALQDPSCVEAILQWNEEEVGYDLHFMTARKTLNYNIYRKGTEYTWHIDAVGNDYAYDMKFTCLLNLSESKVKGGDFFLFESGPFCIKEFNNPGALIAFPSYVPHKVDKVVSGVRKTLTIWFNGPKFR
jgi:hypothetical protein